MFVLAAEWPGRQGAPRGTKPTQAQPTPAPQRHPQRGLFFSFPCGCFCFFHFFFTSAHQLKHFRGSLERRTAAGGLLPQGPRQWQGTALRAAPHSPNTGAAAPRPPRSLFILSPPCQLCSSYPRGQGLARRRTPQAACPSSAMPRAAACGQSTSREPTPGLPHLRRPFPGGRWLQRGRQTKVPTAERKELRGKNGMGAMLEKTLFLSLVREGRWERHVTLSHERF